MSTFYVGTLKGTTRHYQAFSSAASQSCELMVMDRHLGIYSGANGGKARLLTSVVEVCMCLVPTVPARHPAIAVDGFYDLVEWKRVLEY